MTIAFFSNYIHHHQYPISKELYDKTMGNFYFVETQKLDEKLVKKGYPDFSQEPFVVKSWLNSDEYAKASSLVMDADVVLYTIDTLSMVKRRLVTDKLSFDVGERWFKRGLVNILSPRLIKSLLLYHLSLNKESNYKLCASAFGSMDMRLLHAYRGRCYKWGYFTKVEPLEVSALPIPRNGNQVSLMWCARMIDWKHPELPLKLAYKLKSKGYDFVLDMYGGGELKQKMIELSEKLDVASVVKFCGNVPNDMILHEMRQHDIFLFTSDRNEGWGAVANEAMADGCVLVGGDEIGSVPYLVQDGENGSIFKSKNVESLFEAVKALMDNPDKRQSMAVKAYDTISTTWSPAQAAKNLLELIQALQLGNETPVKEGPCSKA